MNTYMQHYSRRCTVGSAIRYPDISPQDNSPLRHLDSVMFDSQNKTIDSFQLLFFQKTIDSIDTIDSVVQQVIKIGSRFKAPEFQCLKSPRNIY